MKTLKGRSISYVENEESWCLFIDNLPQMVYTEDQIEAFPEESNTTTGSPSFKLLCDLRERGLLYKTFLNCLEINKCTKAFNIFMQISEFIYIIRQFVKILLTYILITCTHKHNYNFQSYHNIPHHSRYNVEMHSAHITDERQETIFVICYCYIWSTL